MGPEHQEWLQGLKLISIGVIAAALSASLIISVGRAVLGDEMTVPEPASNIVVVSSTR